MRSIKVFFGSAPAEYSSSRNPALNIIIYLASLASNPRAIDPVLDRMRMITARLQPGQSMNKNDTAQLADVYYKIEDYLTHDEPLRAFTKESLRRKVTGKFQLQPANIETFWQQAGSDKVDAAAAQSSSPQAAARIKYVRKLGRGITIGALVIGCLGFFAPAVPSPEAPYSNNFDLAFSLAASLLLAGAAWLFLRGLDGFKDQLKNIYRLLCAAMILLALAQSQQVIYTYFGWWEVPFIQRGGVAIGFVPAIVCFYVAMRMFARLLDIKSITTSVVAMLVAGGAAAGVAAVLPIPALMPANVVQQALPPTLMLAAVAVFAALMALAVKHWVTTAYTRAMAWLFLGLLSAALIAVIYPVLQLFIPGGSVVLSYGGISLLFVGAGLMMVRSAVAFNHITED